MASNRIKGITIEIGGDTTKLDKALEGTNGQLKTTQANLKDVNRLLKLDPKNVELLDQKQRLLAQSSEFTADKLKTLKKVAEESTVSNVKYKQWQDAFTVLQRQITGTSNEITKLEKEGKRLEGLGFAPDSEPMREVQSRTEALREKIAELNKEVSDTYVALGRPISIQQWDDLQREMAATAHEAKNAEKEFEAFNSSLGKMGPVLSDISGKSGKVAEVFAPVSKAIAGIGTAAIASVPMTEEFRSDLSMLENNARMAGIGVDATREAFEKFAVVSDEVDSSVGATSNLLQAGFTESNLQKAVENLAGAYLSFPDTLKIESLADSLQETLATGTATGQFAEALDRLGIGAETFSKQLALIPGEVERQNYALGALASKGMADVYKGWVDNNQALLENREATLRFQESIARLAEQIQPFLTTLTEMASTFMDWFTGLPEGAQAAVVGIGAFVGIISPIAGIISAITGALTAAGVAGKVFTLAGVGVSATLGQWVLIIGIVIAAVLALAAAIAFLTGRSKELKDIEMPDVPDYSSSMPSGGGRPRSSASPISAAAAPYALRAPTVDNLPYLAQGTVTRPNSPFLAVVGDNPNEPEIISPLSTIERAVRNVMGERGGQASNIRLTVNFTGSAAQLVRMLQPQIIAETNRLGPQFVK